MYVIAYDVGTTGIKSGLFRIEKDHSIDPVAGQVADFDLYILDNGGVEQNPLQWWEAMCKTTPVLLTEAGIGAEEISGISFCAQMQAVVLVDREGNPVRNAMSYMDNRGVEQMRKGIQTGPKVAGMNVFKLLHSLRISERFRAALRTRCGNIAGLRTMNRNCLQRSTNGLMSRIFWY